VSCRARRRKEKDVSAAPVLKGQKGEQNAYTGHRKHLGNALAGTRLSLDGKKKL
jgi:hypothetical protein